MKTLALGLVLWFGVATLVADGFDDGKAAFAAQDWKTASGLLGQYLLANPDASQAPAAAFLRAVALYQLGDFRGSLDGFQKLDRGWPQSPFARRLPYWKGTAALAAGQLALAERELADQAKYPDEQPFSTRALLNLALAKSGLGKSDAAVQALSAFVKASSEAPLLSQAWALWGDEDKQAKRYDAAVEHYRKAWESWPKGTWDLSSRIQAVDILIDQARYPEARGLIEASATAYPGELDRWDDRRIVVLRALKNPGALVGVLEARWDREKNPGVRQTLASNRARLAEDSGAPDAEWWLKASVGPDEVLGASAVQRHAYLLETAGQAKVAAQHLDSWRQAHPGAPPASLEAVGDRAAQDWSAAGDRLAARKAWTRLLASFTGSPKVPSWLLARGRALLDDGDTSGALADLNRVVKDFSKAPEAPEARYQIGLVYLKRQEPARAEAWFYGLVQDLKSGDLYQRALLARGMSFVNSGQSDLARGSLQRLVREDPQGPWAGTAWAALGRNALQLRLYTEAVEAYSAAESLLTAPADRAQALWSLAEAHLAAGDYQPAADAFGRYAKDYGSQPRAAEALYRRGAVWFTAKDWDTALATWSSVVNTLSGDPLVQTREGMALALVRLHRSSEGWDQLALLEKARPSPDSWYRWGQAALALGEGDWATRAFQYLLQTHPDSSAAQAALPRSAGALLMGGKGTEAVDRYAEYFKKFGRQSSSAPVARAAALAALAYPQTFEALVKASRSWDLAPEVATEFSLVWAQSRLDSDPAAWGELQNLSQTAPWTSQRSEALGIAGRWQLARGRLAEARTTLEAAASLGDDLAVFKARWALAQVTEKEGDLATSARQRETLEKAAGPGVPVEFRVQILTEAGDLWEKVGRTEDLQRVKARIQALAP